MPKEKENENNVVDVVKEQNNGNLFDDTPEHTATLPKTYNDHMNNNNIESESSNFMAYFFVLTILTIGCYLCFYNKKKVSSL